MSGRALRLRTSRPNYSALFEDENGAGPSNGPQQSKDDESGSDFQYPDAESSVEDNDNDDGLASMAESDTVYEEALPQMRLSYSPTKPSIHKSSLPSKSRVKTTKLPGIAFANGASERRISTLPVPSVNHRHRAVPIFVRNGHVERLIKQPRSLFETPQLTSTNNFTSSQQVSTRLSKAWAHNVGPGPLWDLTEDRSYFKEEKKSDDEGLASEAKRRPRVYSEVLVPDGWKLLSEGASSAYIPLSSFIDCSFGPYNAQTSIKIPIFESLKLSTLAPQSSSHVFNAGGPVWGLDWCPIHPDDRRSREYKHYLAVSANPSLEHTKYLGEKTARPIKASIQIWELSQDLKSQESQIRCVMVLCIDVGCASDLKWCPLPSHDLVSETATVKQPNPRKLGILGGTFEDGSLSIFVVPEPKDILLQIHDSRNPFYVHLPDPILRVELPDTSFCSLEWANSELIAVGCTNGSVAVYDIASLMRQTNLNMTISNILPIYYASIHQSAVRALAWIRAPPVDADGEFDTEADPTVIATGGYDGAFCLTDIREPNCNTVNRTRDVIIGMTYSGYSGGPVTMDGDNVVKTYAASPSMLGRGQIIAEADGPIWHLHASDYHPGLAIASADGTCRTTNLLRSTRRGTAIPFFVHKIYQMDYSRASGEYRMLDKFLPQESKDRATTRPHVKLQRGEAVDSLENNSTGVWPIQVGVHRVVWNNGNGLSSSGLLASGTACGLCRIDLLDGRWAKDHVPYTSVDKIRDLSGDGDEEEDDDI